MALRFYEILAADAYSQYFHNILTLEDFQTLIALDPSTGNTEQFSQAVKGRFTDWLIKQYKALSKVDKARMLGEDAEMIRRGLALFQKLMKNKEGTEALTGLFADKANVKDINAYSLQDIKTLSHQAPNVEGAAVKSEKRIQVVFNGEGLFVCIPETHEASRKYGTGTNWCTATSNPQWFDNYTKRGPLFIIIDKKDPSEKWQFHGSDFRDKKDRSMTTRRFVDIMEQKGEPYDDEVDQLAEIFAEHFHYKEWTSEEIVEGRIGELKRTLAPLGQITLEDAEHVSVRGYSLLAHVLLYGGLNAGELLTELAPSLSVSVEDLSRYLATGNARAEMLQILTSFMSDKAVVQGFYKALGTTVGFSLIASILNDGQPTPTEEGKRALRDLFAKMASATSILFRSKLLKGAGRSLFPEAALKYITRYPDHDDYMLELLTTLFPELLEASSEPLQEKYLYGGLSRNEYERQYMNTTIKGLFTQEDTSVAEVRKLLLALFATYAYAFPKTVQFLGKKAPLDISETVALVQTLIEQPINYKKQWIKVVKALQTKGNEARTVVAKFIADHTDELDWKAAQAAAAKVIQQTLPQYEEELARADFFSRRRRLTEALAPISTMYYWEGDSTFPDGPSSTPSPSIVSALLSALQKGKHYTMVREPKFSLMAEKVVLPALEQAGLAQQLRSKLDARTDGAVRLLEVALDWYTAAQRDNDLQKALAPIKNIFAKEPLSLDVRTRLDDIYGGKEVRGEVTTPTFFQMATKEGEGAPYGPDYNLDAVQISYLQWNFGPSRYSHVASLRLTASYQDILKDLVADLRRVCEPFVRQVADLTSQLTENSTEGEQLRDAWERSALRFYEEYLFHSGGSRDPIVGSRETPPWL